MTALGTIVDKIASAIQAQADEGTGKNEPPLERRWCMVTAIDLTTVPMTCTATVSGTSTAGIPCTGSYVPTVGDKALILQEGRDLVAVAANNNGITWQHASLINSWVHNGGPGPSGGYCSYRRTGNIVRLAGSITGGANNTVAFVLPTGYRPTYTVEYIVRNSGGAVLIDVISIDSSGNVLITSLGSGSNGVYFDAITFTID